MQKKRIYILIFISIVSIALLIWFWSTNNSKYTKVQTKIEYSDLDIIYGIDSAPIHIVMFSNYNCGFCRKFYFEDFNKLKAEYIDKGIVKLVIKPISFNDNSFDIRALKITACLAKYGNVDKMNQLLFTQPEIVSNKQFDDIINDFVEQDEFIAECMLSGEAENYITKNYLQFLALDFNGTPSFVINNIAIKGYVKYADLKAVIEQFL